MIKNISTLRPGLLVSLGTSITGNVKYFTKDLERRHRTKQGEEKAKWETERTVSDPEEHELAIKARTAARICITRVCKASAFHLLCLESDRDLLDEAIVEAEKIASDFNKSAQLTRLNLNIMVAEIAADDERAMKSINSDIRRLLDAMQDGVKNLDVKTIRDAAAKAKNISEMLEPNTQARLRAVVETVRKSATQIVALGETAAAEIDQAALRRIKEARTAFLDLSETQEVAKPVAKKARRIELQAAED